MTVYILTWCGFPERIHGATLVFKTIRTGFPNADIAVIDRNSIPEARSKISIECQRVGAKLLQLDNSITHAQFINQVVSQHKTGPMVICDPDVVFWGNMETLEFSGLVAGRLIPKYRCPVQKAITYPRLHPSLLWIQNVQALRNQINDMENYIAPGMWLFDPFAQQMFQLDGQWYFFDTASHLYCAMPDRVECFPESVLDKYDHLFCGSYLNVISKCLSPDIASMFEESDQHATGDIAKLRGLWKKQESVFQSLRIE